MSTSPYYPSIQRFSSGNLTPYTGAFYEFRRIDSTSSVEDNITHQGKTKIQKGLQRGVHDVWMHLPNIFLMGASALLYPLLPKPFKMSFKHSLYMAPVHMAAMALINLGVGFFRGIQGTSKMNHKI